MGVRMRITDAGGLGCDVAGILAAKSLWLLRLSFYCEQSSPARLAVIQHKAAWCVLRSQADSWLPPEPHLHLHCAWVPSRQSPSSDSHERFPQPKGRKATPIFFNFLHFSQTRHCYMQLV